MNTVFRRVSRRDMEVLRAKSSRKLHARHCVVALTPTPGLPTALTCVVSKKVARHAVDRNKIKRRIREAFRQVDVVPYQYTLIVYPRISVLSVPFAELVEDIQTCLKSQKMGIQSTIHT